MVEIQALTAMLLVSLAMAMASPAVAYNAMIDSKARPVARKSPCGMEDFRGFHRNICLKNGPYFPLLMGRLVFHGLPEKPWLMTPEATFFGPKLEPF